MKKDPELDEFISDWYRKADTDLILLNVRGLSSAIQEKFGRSIHTANISRMAKRLGFNHGREFIREQGKLWQRANPTFSSDTIREWIKKNGHPRGMFGKKHTPRIRSLLSRNSKKMWKERTNEERRSWANKQALTRIKNKTNIPNNKRRTWKAAWREIGDQRFFFRSSWEYNYAQILQYLLSKKQITSWEYEPTTFLFEKIIRGTRTYTPDFLVHYPDGIEEYHEVKGWIDSRSRIQQKRMRIYYPKIKMQLIETKAYKALESKFSRLIENWE